MHNVAVLFLSRYEGFAASGVIAVAVECSSSDSAALNEVLGVLALKAKALAFALACRWMFRQLGNMGKSHEEVEGEVALRSQPVAHWILGELLHEMEEDQLMDEVFESCFESIPVGTRGPLILVSVRVIYVEVGMKIHFEGMSNSLKKRQKRKMRRKEQEKQALGT